MSGPGSRREGRILLLLGAYETWLTEQRGSYCTASKVPRTSGLIHCFLDSTFEAEIWLILSCDLHKYNAFVIKYFTNRLIRCLE